MTLDNTSPLQEIHQGNDQVVAVIGAGGLIGKHICEDLLLRGRIVALVDLDTVALNWATDETAPYFKNAHVVRMNIVDEESIRTAIDSISTRFGRVDSVVNVAYPRGKNYGKPLSEVSYENFCENLDLHLGGYFLVSKLFSDYFASKNGGHVLNFASVYGLMAPRFEIYEETSMTMPVEYAAIKSGIIAMSRYFAKFHLKNGVRFNCIAPGGVFDNQPDSFIQSYSKHAGQIGMILPQQVSAVVSFLLSSSAEAINGQTIVVDDGWTL